MTRPTNQQLSIDSTVTSLTNDNVSSHSDNNASSTSSTRRSSPANISSSNVDKISTSVARRFDSALNRVIDMKKIDLKRLDKWLHDYLSSKRVHEFKLIIDLLIDFLKSERFPDPKVVQCGLAEYNLLSSEKIKRLMRRLWVQLYELECESQSTHSAKYQKTSTTNGSSDKLSASNSYHHGYSDYYGYNSHSYQNHQANQL